MPSLNLSCLTLVLIITRKCNLNCNYCRGLLKNSFIDKEVAFKAIDLYSDYLNNSSGLIKIFGGEPLLNIDLLQDIIKYIRNKIPKTKIEVSTNGVLLTTALSSWLKKNNVKLSLSLDGNNSTQLLNRKGQSLQDYRRITQLVRQSSSYLNINMVIAPNNVKNLFRNFVYLYNLGVKKINFLPAAYNFWPTTKLKLLENNFNLINSFVQDHPNIYIKNIDINNEIYFYNVGIAVDYDAEMFVSDLITSKDFHSYKKELRLGNVNNINSFKRLDFMKKKKRIKSLIKKALDPKIFESSNVLDKKLDIFVEQLKLKEFKRVDLKTGFLCNNHCRFCVQGSKRSVYGNKSTKLLKEELRKAAKECNSVVFTGGEATVREDFLELVRYAKKSGFREIQIQTNGRMFAYRKFAQETIKAGATEFGLALHGHSAQLHDFLTNVQGSFKNTIQGIRNLKSLSQRVITNTVITKPNYRNLPEIAMLLVSLGVDQYQLAFVHPMGTVIDNFDSIVPRMTMIEPYVKRGLDVGIKSGKRVMTEAIPYCFMQGYEDYIAEKIIPTTKIYDFNSVVENFTLVRQKEGKLKNKNCKRCKYYNLCEGPWREYPEHFGWSEFVPVKK